MPFRGLYPLCLLTNRALPYLIYCIGISAAERCIAPVLFFYDSQLPYAGAWNLHLGRYLRRYDGEYKIKSIRSGTEAGYLPDGY